MQNQQIIFAALVLLAVVSKLWGRFLYKYTKALPIAFILFLSFLKTGPLPTFWLVGLCFGLAGDLLLLSSRGFLAGLLSFLLGHLCYSIAFYRQQQDMPDYRVIIPTLAVAVVAYTYLARLLIAGRNKKFLIPVLFYVAMTAWVVSQGVYSKSTPAIIGCLLFAGSDFLLAFNKFSRQTKYAEAGVTLTYYPAQWLLAVHFARL